MRVAALQLLIAFAFAVSSASSFAASRRAVQHAERFALGGTGAAGVMSEGERALREVLASPDAVQRLESMLPSASDAGRLYILVGLRMRDRAAYRRALDSCSQRQTRVPTIRGCTIIDESFRSLVREIDRGGFDVFIKRRW